MKHLFLIILFLNFSTMLFSQSKADDIIGVWYSPVKEGNVHIFKSGKHYYGRLTDLKHAVYNHGKPVLDVNNPDKEKRKMPLVGILLLKKIHLMTRSTAGRENSMIMMGKREVPMILILPLPKTATSISKVFGDFLSSD